MSDSKLSFAYLLLPHFFLRSPNEVLILVWVDFHSVTVLDFDMKSKPAPGFGPSTVRKHLSYLGIRTIGDEVCEAFGD